MDTFPGFALRCAPGSQAVFDTLVEETGTGLWPWRHYEVFLEHRACAQYFDLEYSRELNPEMDPGAVTDAFFFMLRAFLLQTLGLEPVVASVWELDSTTAGKYSKHIVVKRLVSVGGCSKDIEGSSSATQHFKWRDNAQAGLFVAQFLEYCRRQREIDPMSPARLLFARASLSSAVAAAGSGFAGGGCWREVPIIDDSVYSRNRCFRVAFSSKFGQRRPLRPLLGCNRVASAEPGFLLLHSLASFVSGGEALLCARGLVPEDAGHATVGRPRRCSAVGQVQSVPQGFPTVAPCEDTLLAGVLEVLVRAWDAVRSEYEPGHARMGVLGSRLRWMSRDRRYCCVSLRNNRFCLCKGASHLSNHVYLVVNVSRAIWYQKCHDADCGAFKSMEFSFPPHASLLPSVEPSSKRRRCDVLS